MWRLPGLKFPVVFLATLAVALLANAWRAEARDVVIAGNDARLIAALNGFLRLPGAPPGVIVTIRRGKVLEEYAAGLGVLPCSTAICDPVRRPRAYDSMRIASLAKTFSGAVALALVTDGVLSLNDTIGQWLPGLPSQWHEVTLRQLLNHTSGLPDFGESKAFAIYATEHPTDPPPPVKLLDFVKNRPLNFPPGSEYRYSNSDNIAVALMAEAASGRPYTRLLAREVFRPVGLKHTVLPDSVLLPRPYIHGYLLEDNGTIEDVSEVVDFGGYAWASGGLVSTPRDLGAFAQAYVGGKLFGKRQQAQQRKFIAGGESSPPGPGQNSVGLALFRYQTRCGPVFGHTGSILGYMQFVAATGNGKRAIALTINAQVGKDLIPDLRKVEELAVCVALGRS